MKSILLAEDDSDDRELFASILDELNRHDVHLQMADNGIEVINALNDMKSNDLPSLIVLDQNMPKMTGKETFFTLQRDERYKHIPTVIYSTYHDAVFMSDCKRLGVELIQKPDSYDGFVTMVSSLLQKIA